MVVVFRVNQGVVLSRISRTDTSPSPLYDDISTVRLPLVPTADCGEYCHTIVLFLFLLSWLFGMERGLLPPLISSSILAGVVGLIETHTERNRVNFTIACLSNGGRTTGSTTHHPPRGITSATLCRLKTVLSGAKLFLNFQFFI